MHTAKNIPCQEASTACLHDPGGARGAPFKSDCATPHLITRYDDIDLHLADSFNDSIIVA